MHFETENASRTDVSTKRFIGQPITVAPDNATAHVFPGTIFDTTAGPILIDEHATVRPGAILLGPCSVGPHATVLERAGDLAAADGRDEAGIVLDHDESAAGEREAAHDLFDAHLPLLRYEQQPGPGLAVRKYILQRRGLLTSAALRKPGALLTPAARGEVDHLLKRLARRDSRADLG